MGRKAKTGERLTPAQQELALTCLPLAYKLARRFVAKGRRYLPDVEEAEGVALLSLCRAALRFDPGRGVKFVTYAWPGIQNALAGWAEKNRRRRGGYRYPKGDWRATTSSLSYRDGGLTSQEPADHDSRPAPPGQRDTPDPDEALAALEGRERDVLDQCLLRGRKMVDLQGDWGVCRERVRQVKEDALARLREKFADGAAAEDKREVLPLIVGEGTRPGVVPKSARRPRQ